MYFFGHGFCITKYRKLKNIDNVARAVFKIIYWIEHGSNSSIKKYNDLKQRLMKIGMKNLFDY